MLNNIYVCNEKFQISTYIYSTKCTIPDDIKGARSYLHRGKWSLSGLLHILKEQSFPENVVIF